MKAFVVAVATTALLTTAASAQGMGRGRHGQAQKAAEAHKPKVDDKAYKDALGRIPNADQPVDPWRGVRDAPPAK